MADETTTSQANKGGVPSQSALYNKIAARSEDILNALYEGLYSKQPAIKLGAAKVLINKILPDLKSVEVQGGLNADGSHGPIQLLVNLGGGFVPPNIQISPTSAGGITTSPPTVQGIDMAPKGEENVHSDNGSSEASPR